MTSTERQRHARRISRARRMLIGGALAGTVAVSGVAAATGLRSGDTTTTNNGGTTTTDDSTGSGSTRNVGSLVSPGSTSSSPAATTAGS